MTSSLFPNSAGAEFSPCRTWRYRLWRTWNPTIPALPWVLANPSIADETVLDPTLRRVADFTNRLAFGGFVIVNVWALVSTDPRGLDAHADPIGPENDRVLTDIALTHDHVMVGWGAIGDRDPQRIARVAELLGVRAHCLGTTKSGAPRHPLYLKSSTPMERWRPLTTTESST